MNPLNHAIIIIIIIIYFENVNLFHTRVRVSGLTAH